MRLGVRTVLLMLAGCAGAGAAIAVGAGGCVMVPPPELQTQPARPPRILHESVSPPERTPLTVWPDALSPLLVPVVVDDPSGQYDYLAWVDPTSRPEPVRRQRQPLVSDGGVTLHISIEPLEANPEIDIRACHDILVKVARSFQNFVPDPVGGDSAEWRYVCQSPDASSALGDASTDGPGVSLVPVGGDP
jgi:hypothetical protein